MQQYFPVITGEWYLFNSLARGHETRGGQSVLNGVNGEDAVTERGHGFSLYPGLGFT